ncbi:MAG TPA: hypothetical protein VIQ02_08340 [Jiangellaceae bacterium]
MEQIVAERAPGAANGLDQVSAEDALATVLSALADADSYHVTGTSTSGEAIDISFVEAGAMGTVGSDKPVRLVALDGRLYVTGDAEFLATSVGKDAAKRMADKWLLLPRDSASEFSIFADGETFATTILGAEGSVEMSGVRTVKGVPAVGLVFPQTGGTLWVSAQGDPLPIQFEEKGASAGAGILTFTDFGADVAIKAPPKDSVVDVEKLPAP